MITTIQPGRAGPFPHCSSFVVLERACGSAGPFFMAHQGGEPAGKRIFESRGDRFMSPAEPSSKHGSQEGKSSQKGKIGRRGVARKQVVSRLWRTAERQVEEIESRMNRLDDDHQALEREAKTLAVIAKTVRDLVAIDGEAQSAANRLKGAGTAHGKNALRQTTSEDKDRDAGGAIRSFDEFRAELTRRLDELRRERRGGETS
jgi:hypothetical protein